MTRRYFRVVGQRGIYEYRQLPKHQGSIEVYCLIHGWTEAMSSGACLKCLRERLGLEEEEK